MNINEATTWTVWMIVDGRTGEILINRVFLDESHAEHAADREPMICHAERVAMTLTLGIDPVELDVLKALEAAYESGYQDGARDYDERHRGGW